MKTSAQRGFWAEVRLRQQIRLQGVPRGGVLRDRVRHREGELVEEALQVVLREGLHPGLLGPVVCRNDDPGAGLDIGSLLGAEELGELLGLFWVLRAVEYHVREP